MLGLLKSSRFFFSLFIFSFPSLQRVWQVLRSHLFTRNKSECYTSAGHSVMYFYALPQSFMSQDTLFQFSCSLLMKEAVNLHCGPKLLICLLVNWQTLYKPAIDNSTTVNSFFCESLSSLSCNNYSLLVFPLYQQTSFSINFTGSLFLACS